MTTIINPRTKQHKTLKSYITTDFVDPAQPKMTQVHGSKVVVVDSQDQTIGEADGMITTLPKLELQVRIADCGNIYFYDPIADIIGICHAGWKGSHLNIIQNVIDTMIGLGSQAQNVRTRTGPCISGKNYEFGSEVTELFDTKYYSSISGLYYLNLPMLHRDQLLGGGVIAKHIIQSTVCTFDAQNMPSYRRNGADTGRITGSIMMI